MMLLKSLWQLITLDYGGWCFSIFMWDLIHFYISKVTNNFIGIFYNLYHLVSKELDYYN